MGESVAINEGKTGAAMSFLVETFNGIYRKYADNPRYAEKLGMISVLVQMIPSLHENALEEAIVEGGRSGNREFVLSTYDAAMGLVWAAMVVQAIPERIIKAALTGVTLNKESQIYFARKMANPSKPLWIAVSYYLVTLGPQSLELAASLMNEMALHMEEWMTE